MDYIVGIQNALNYVEEHLADEIDLSEAARSAACSEFYFQRIFSLLCGVTVGEYIRMRRLTLAGSELSATDARVIDTALKYGYDTPESFARAFQKFHGITPSEAKRNSSKLKAFSRLSVKLTLSGGSTMDYKIIEKQAFDVLERVEAHSIADEANRTSIPDFWTRSHADGTVQTLLDATSDRTFIFGICYGNSDPDSKTFDYSIAAVCDENTAVPSGFRRSTIPARTWAVFECKGAMPEAIQTMWHRITTEFFPTSGYEPTYEMDIEAYTQGDMSAADYRSEIWVPVNKK